MKPATRRALRALEALFFLVLGIDFIAMGGQGGAWAIVAGAAVLLRAGAAAAFAVKERAAYPPALGWGAWFVLLVGGIDLLVGASYILWRGTRAVIPHAALAVLGAGLLAWAALELRALRRESAASARVRA